VLTTPHLFADFNNADKQGRVRLNCAGTMDDLARQQIELREGLGVLLYTDDADEHGNLARMTAEGTVAFSEQERCWVAAIDWQKIAHESGSAVNEVGSDAHQASLDAQVRTVPQTGRPLSR
jgi:hypothetical protein